MALTDFLVDALREAVHERGISLYRIGLDTAIDRARLSRYLKGTPITNARDVDVLCEYFMVEPASAFTRNKFQLNEFYRLLSFHDQKVEELKQLRAILDTVVKELYASGHPASLIENREQLGISDFNLVDEVQAKLRKQKKANKIQSLVDLSELDPKYHDVDEIKRKLGRK